MSYSRTATPLTTRLATFALILGALALASCGSGGAGGGGGASSSGTPRDPVGSQAAVNDGMGQLQDMLDTVATTPPPYTTIATISQTFTTAANLDPENPTAAFFAAVGNVVLFLDSDAGKAFLSKLGWDNFRDNNDDFYAFVQDLGTVISGLTGTTVTFTPPVKNPNTFVFGVGGDLTVGDLLQFVTVTLPASLQTSVDLLATIPPDWTFSVAITLPTGGTATAPAGNRKTLDTGDGTTITIGYTEAMALRAALSALQAGLSAPGVWTFTGIDDFYEANKDQMDSVALSTAVQDYFKGPDLPLSNNPAGVTQVTTSLDSFLDSFTSAIVSLRADQPDPTRLLSVSGVFSGDLQFDAQAATISYSLDAFGLTATDLKAALHASHDIGVYQPVAFIQNFSTCDPFAASAETTNYDPLNVPPTDLTITIGEIGANVVTVATDGTSTSPTTTVSGTDYYFKFDLSGATDLSIFTTGSVATTGAVAYQDGQGNLVGWDSDAGSADGTNFGISIASGYFDTDYMGSGFPGMGVGLKGAVTLWVRVTAASPDFQLKVITSPTGGESSPIFLKGGGGRTFAASTYRIGSVTNANLGNLVRTAGMLFDLSTRSSLVVDTSAAFPVTSLMYPVGPATTQVKTVLSGLNFLPPLTGTGSVDVIDIESWQAGLPANIQDLVDLTPVVWPTDTPLAPFCAYPKDLMQARLFVGGHSIGIGF